MPTRASAHQPLPALFIADPGLRGPSGHHPSAAALLGKMAGFRSVEVFAHQRMEASVEPLLHGSGLTAHRHFTRYLYDDAFKDVPLTTCVSAVQALSAEMAVVDQRARAAALDSPVVVLHHTVDWFQLQALAHALPPPDKQRVVHAVFLLFNPGVGHDGTVPGARRLLNYRVALQVLKARPDVKLFASCEEYRQAYAGFCDLGRLVGLHPNFHFDAPGWLADALSPLQAKPATKPPASTDADTVLLYLGDAKAAKGFLDLPRLAAFILERTRLKVWIHHVVDDGLRSPEIDQAASALQALAERQPRLRLQTGYLSEAALHSLLANAGLVVFNYRTQAYADKTSGLLWQAAGAGASVAVIGESWLAREARRLCARVRIHASPMALVLDLQRQGGVGTARGNTEMIESYRQALFAPLESFLQRLVRHEPSNALTVQRPKAIRSGLAPAIGDTEPAVLFVDAELPDPQRTAGGHAAVQEIRLLVSLGLPVAIGVLNDTAADSSQIARWEAEGVRWAGEGRAVLAHLRHHGQGLKLVYITRFHVAERLVSHVRRWAPDARLVLNLADYHYLRLQREAAIRGDAELAAHAAQIRARETAVMAQMDLVLTYTEEEATLIQLALRGQVPVGRLPWVAQNLEGPRKRRKGFAARRDLLFLGGFSHAPNVDAVQWFVAEVMPLLRRQLPGVRLRVCGADAGAAIHALACDDVVIEGFVPDLRRLLGECRVFVAPLRFGAGLKGKVVNALEAGLPTVASAVAAEGFIGPGEMGVAAIVSTPAQWVEVLTRIHSDEVLWNALSEAATRYAARHFTFERAQQTFRALLIGAGVSVESQGAVAWRRADGSARVGRPQ